MAFSQRLIPAHEHRIEITVANSRFISTLAPAHSVEQARAIITRVKGDFSDASHNVSAFIIGHGQSLTEHCHDDGEPSGTAGRPTLAVLRGSGLGDVVAVVTRYFGGVKLGKGGLVRAYGDAVRTGLESLPLAEKVSTQTLLIRMPYHWYEQVRRLAEEHHAQILNEDFAGNVTLKICLRASEVLALQDQIVRLTHGTVTGNIIETQMDSIFPV